MRKFLIIILALLIMLPATTEMLAADDPYEEPTITVEVPSSITPNSDISIKINIKNTTGTRMWRSKVYIDTISIPSNIRQYLEFFETEEYLTRHLVIQGLKDVLYPDEEVDLAFRIKANSQIPAVTIPIYIVLETEIGLCEEGCAPYRRTVEYEVVVIRDDPNLFLELDLDEARLNVGDCYIAKGNFTVGHTIENTSQTTAFNVNLSVANSEIPLSTTITPQMPLANIKPGNSTTGLIYVATGNLSPGTYTITVDLSYRDYYGKAFYTSDTFKIVVVSTAYELLEEGELYLLSCSYQNAISAFESAMALYEEVDYQELAERCYRRIELINGIILFKQAQSYYHLGDYESASDTYALSKQHYENANDCTGTSLCQDAINAIENNPTPPANGGNGGHGGGLTTLDLSLVLVIIVLAGVVVILLVGKRR
ncbi:MAG: hypothetical protein JW825_00105 [Candidatus Methanofastidiosa archaeon]|nr:hypothetical protein [Candidatus Methanofastidiosa archaeon]